MISFRRPSSAQLSLALATSAFLCFSAVGLIWLLTEGDALRAVRLPEYQLPAMTGSAAESDDLSAVLARPLFWVSRAPVAAQSAEAAAETQPDSGEFKLLGTILRGDAHTALLQTTSGIVRVQLDSQLPGGWTVIRVESGSVRMSNGSCTLDIVVEHPRSSSIMLERLDE